MIGKYWGKFCRNGKKMEIRDKLRNQIEDAAGNVQYTYVTHWKIVNRLMKKNKWIKIFQIVLTIISTGGFLAIFITQSSDLSWVGGGTSALSLALNLYVLNFDLPRQIKVHTDAANDLWGVREAYKSLLVDFDNMELYEIQEKRDEIIKRIDEINRRYPGTDDKSFQKAQEDMSKYKFADGEAAELLHFQEKQK